MIKKTTIRFFEFPQVFISLEYFDKSTKFIRRNLGYICPRILDLCSIDNTFGSSPQTVKIEQAKYIFDDVSMAMTVEKLFDVFKEKNFLRPCKISTLVRIILDNLGDINLLPSLIKENQCFAIASKKLIFQVDFSGNKITCNVIENPENFIINPDACIIMETDPV